MAFPSLAHLVVSPTKWAIREEPPTGGGEDHAGEQVEPLGVPPGVPLVAVVGGFSFPVDANCAQVVIDGLFIRGDGNGNGIISLADPLFNLGYQFQGQAALCLDALDTNDDGNIDISDPIFNLGFQLLAGPSPPPPFLDCGVDPTADTLACEVLRLVGRASSRSDGFVREL